MYMHHWGGGEQDWFINMPLWSGTVLSFVLFVAIWSLVWKGLALWHAGRRGDAWWFVIIMFVNTLGILEIIYLFAIAKLKISELFSKHTHHN